MKLAFQWFVSAPSRTARLISKSAAAVLALLALGLGATVAAPFDKEFQFTQPDGVAISIHGQGDEFSAVFESLEGYTVVFDQAQKAYCYAEVAADGKLVSTGIQPQKANPSSLNLAPHLRMSREARRDQVVGRYLQWEQAMQINPRWEALKLENRAYESALKSGAQFAPPRNTTVGTKIGLTILVDFSDDPATLPQMDVIDYLNADNYTGYGNNGSVKKYFQDVSNGRLTYSNVVTIYITAPQPKTTYNDVTQDAGTMGNNLLKDVLDTMKALPNYSTTILPTFDNLTVDNNNNVVACNVFFAGNNSGVWAMGLWPHSGALGLVGAQELSPGGKKIFRYQITDIGNRLAIGTFAHENGHMLCGFPDLYDYDYDSTGGAGYFCLMGSGGVDLNPSQVCAYLKRAAGWATTTELSTTSTLLAMVSARAGTNFNHFYRFEKPGVPTEYYLVENRQTAGRDSWLPGGGVAIWHVDELGDRDNQSLAYNGAHANYECTLVQADNAWHFQRNINAGDSGDLWQAENNSSAYRNEFNDTTTPSARWWDGANSGVYFSDFGSNANTMTFQVGYGLALKVAQTTVIDGNGNGLIDFNECTDLFIVLTNGGGLGASNISATLSTVTPGVVVAQRLSAYPNIGAGETATNLLAYKVSTAPDFNCGSPIHFTLAIKSDMATATNTFVMQTGLPGLPLRFNSAAPVDIPDFGETNSTIVVSNVAFAANKVTVSVYLSHTYDGDLLLQLISPGGITNTLSRYRGGSGQNYGIKCSPDIYRTVFDDAAVVPIGTGAAPFLGLHRPEQPLSVYSGKAGTNLNGGWKLRVVDSARFDFGTLQCWSLDITPTVCADGLGECPGADLSVGLTAQPEPATSGSDLLYTISVTNRGPSTAKSVTVSQLLPPSVIYRSSQSSQGAVSAAGNVVTCNLGGMAVGARATISVEVTTTADGAIGSSATVSSEQTDFDLANNTATFVSHINPPTSDLVVGIAPSASSIPLGGSITYVVAVTNKGPSTASSVMLTNTFAPGLVITSATASQGTAVTSSNLVVCAFNSLALGARATATITVVPLAEGAVVASSRVSAAQNDPIAGNNSATAVVAVGPAADLALSIVDNPDPVVTGNELTYTVTVTNRGPSASGNVVLTTAVSPGVHVTSVVPSAGSVTQLNNTITADFGNLPSGGTALLTIIGTALVDGTNTTTASVFGSQPDPVAGNNTATINTLAAGPFVRFIAAGATLTAESVLPANGAIDAGETVTAKLFLRNSGNIGASNVVATLLATNGVTPAPSGNPQVYGDLATGGLPVDRSFTFTASSASSVTAVLRVQTDTTVTNVAFTFSLPVNRAFGNTAPIVIRDNQTADPYPSTINVTGLTGIVGKVTVTLSNFTHTFPQDVDVLLVGPGDQKVILMSGAGAANAVNANLTFDQTAAQPLPSPSGQLLSGTWRPASYLANVTLPSVAAPYGSSLESLNAVNPNGLWKLYVNDHTDGDQGLISSGWSLGFTMLKPVNQVADLALTALASPTSVLAGSDATFTYTVVNSGPNTATFVAFTSQVPGTAALISASASQGETPITVGGQVTVNLSGIAAGGSATVTLVVRPGVPGALVCPGAVNSPAENDLNTVNNTASATVQVGRPIADLACSLEATRAPVVLSSNVMFSVIVTNSGVNAALNVVVSNTLPAGSAFVSANPTAGVTTNGQSVVWVVGTLAAANSARLDLELQGVAVTNGVFTAAASTTSLDQVQSNNVAQATLFVGYPTPAFESAGAILRAESGPVNGSVDPNEQITVSLALRNVGSRDVTNLMAALVSGNGVINPGPSQDFGVVAMNGAAVSRVFTFTATATEDRLVTATLELSEGGTNSLGTVNYVFNLPVTASFANPAAVTIPPLGVASVYPMTNTVSGLTGAVSKVRVSLMGLTHSFPLDVNALLVSPSGERALVLSHAGGGHPITNVNVTFDDAASALLSKTAAITSGTFLPTSYDAQPAFLPVAPAGPYATQLGALNGIDPNGVWKLFVMDDHSGDGGSIVNGWSLEITTVKTVNPLADLAISLASAPQTPFVGEIITNVITVNNLGPAKATGVIVTNTLPAGVSFRSGSAGVTGGTNEIVVCLMSDIAAGGSATATVLTVAELGGTLLNRVSVTSAAETDLQPANNVAETTLQVFGVERSVLSGALEGADFAISYNAQPSFSYVLQGSTNLIDWSGVSTNVCPPAGVIKIVLPLSGNGSGQFYRSLRVLP